jgi:hypothetical protein
VPTAGPTIAAVRAVAGAHPWASRQDSETADTLARHARMSAEEILEMRRQGRGWSAIKRVLGITFPRVPDAEAEPVPRVDVIV